MATIKDLKNQIATFLDIEEKHLTKNDHFKNAKHCLNLKDKKKLNKSDLTSILEFFNEGLYACNLDGSFLFDDNETTVEVKSEAVDETTVEVKSEAVDETTKQIAIEKYQNLGLVIGNEANPVITFSIWQDGNMTKQHKDTAINVVISGKASKDKAKTLVYTVIAVTKNKQYNLYELSFNSNFALSFNGLKDANTPIPYPCVSLNSEIQNAQTFGQLGLISLGEINNLSPIVELNSRNIQVTSTLVILLGKLLSQSGDKLTINESYEKSFNRFSDLEKVNMVLATANHLKTYLGEKYLNKTVVGMLASNLNKQLEASKDNN